MKKSIICFICSWIRNIMVVVVVGIITYIPTPEQRLKHKRSAKITTSIVMVELYCELAKSRVIELLYCLKSKYFTQSVFLQICSNVFKWHDTADYCHISAGMSLCSLPNTTRNQNSKTPFCLLTYLCRIFSWF